MMFLARTSAGLILWASGFSLLYGLHGIGCASGWNEIQMADGTLLRWLLVSTWVLLCLGATAVIWLARTTLSGFERQLSVTSAVAGFAATLIAGAPVVLNSPCV